ncbi:MAG: CoA transferase [Reyranella sp.]|nr:CoA transferase [Reyranella sp.]MDP3163252.1 CoA transferase [Reyranella sp.]
MAGALDGLVVLDLTTHLSGPFCGMQLADLGADVLKIESPQGDSMRGAPPFIEGESAPFMLWNRNKRGTRLDLKDAGDLEIFWDLVDGADVVLENFRPGVMDRLGIGWAALSARNPRLVLGSVSGFGQTGPYAKRGGFDLIIQAMSGLMSVTGPKDGPPYRIPLAISDVGAGLYLTIGILAALQARQKTGQGQWVETSLLEATVSLGVYEAANYFANGLRPEKLGQAHRGSAPYQVFQTADGWITIGAAQQNFFRKVCALVGKPELADDPRFKSNADRVKNNDLIVGLLQEQVIKRTTAEWMVALEAEGIPAGPVLHHDEVFADPQILARGMVAEVDHAKAGRQKTLGVPLKLSATPSGVRRAAPTLGQHDADVRAEVRSRAKSRKKS